jgi:hypothetical protein
MKMAPKTGKILSYLGELSFRDFFSTSKPWVLVDDGSFLGYFEYVPAHLRCGPWSRVATFSFVAILYSLSAEGFRVHTSGGWTRYFDCTVDQDYVAYNNDWYLTLACFLWMMFVIYNIITSSPVGLGAWTTFTVWSWTIVTIRYGLSVMAPFWTGARRPLEVLKFPALLSASITFFMWNFLLFPLLLYFMEGEKRRSFFMRMTGFRLTQLHVFNIFFATANGALLGPKRTLNYGDIGAATAFLVVYMICYYCILDRLGIHLYPIFSPRTHFVVCSYGLLFGVCYVAYHGWQIVLQSLI